MPERQGFCELERIFGKGNVVHGHKSRYLFRMPEEVAQQVHLESIKVEHERLFLDLAHFLNPDSTRLLFKDRHRNQTNYYFPYTFNVRDVEIPVVIENLKRIETGAYDALMGYPIFRQREKEENEEREQWFVLSRLNDLNPNNKWHIEERDGKQFYCTQYPVAQPQMFTYYLGEILENFMPLQAKGVDVVAIPVEMIDFKIAGKLRDVTKLKPLLTPVQGFRVLLDLEVKAVQQR